MPLVLPSFITNLSPIPLGILTSSTFLISLVLLERSSDTFISSTATLSHRLRVPPILIALITAGCEWEELAVVVAALGEGDQGLALGDVWGSMIANVLGGMGVGLIVGVKGLGRTERTSARIYTSAMFLISLVLAIVSSGVGPFAHLLNNSQPEGDQVYSGSKGAVRALGWTLIALFGVYLGGIGWGVYRGLVVPPEDSDSDSDSDSDAGTESDSDVPEFEEGADGAGSTLVDGAVGHHGTSPIEGCPSELDEHAPLLPPSTAGTSHTRPSPRPLARTLLSLFLSTLLLSLSGLLLSLSCTLLSSPKLLNLQSSKVGLTLLSLATTIPEKVLAFKAGRKGEVGVVVANTVGGNVFLGTLVLGLCWVVEGRIGYESTSPDSLHLSGTIPRSASTLSGSSLDAFISLVCSFLLLGIVWLDLWRRSVGAGMLVLYVGYIVSVFYRD